jgi:hypothetical protein
MPNGHLAAKPSPGDSQQPYCLTKGMILMVSAASSSDPREILRCVYRGCANTQQNNPSKTAIIELRRLHFLGNLLSSRKKEWFIASEEQRRSSDRLAIKHTCYL